MKKVALIIGLIIVGFSIRAEARTNLDDLAGRVVAEADGRQIELPLLQSRVSVNIEADMATVEITQVFENPAQVPVHAEYLFPLNQEAAVYGMEMHIGDEVVTAIIQEKAEAQATFDQAQEEGKSAALLTQHRPNMFTQNIANLMPGQPIEVRLRYVQMVPKVDGDYELVIPLIVGPRYQGAPEPDDQIATLSDEPLQTPGSWSVAPLPAYPNVSGLDIPDTIADGRVSLDLSMMSGVDLGAFHSPTHALDIQTEDRILTARFADGKVLDNRDLVLRYSLQGEEVQSAAFSHTDERGGFVSLMIEPPQIPDENTVTPRELVFVLDTSASMGGAPMQASKRFMMAALEGLRPEDYVRIIPFSNTAHQMNHNALRASPENLRAAERFVRNLRAGGGTEIDRAIRAAFATAQPEGTLRIVVFLSDGYIGQEAEVLKTINQQIGDARIYAFGVGNAVNRYLLDGMAEEGRGYARYVGLDEDALEVAETLARDLKSPLLTDIEIDWGDIEVSDMSPARLPDLFAGNALRVYARHQMSGETNIRVTGLVNGRPATLEVPVSLTDSAAEPALPLIWARNRIAVLERNIAIGERPTESNEEITELGLDFSLQTRNTSFVAVSDRVVNDAVVATAELAVPLPMVNGVESSAYPSGFAGSSTPEPHMWLGMLSLAALSLMRVRRRQKH